MDSNERIIQSYLNHRNNSIEYEFGTEFKFNRILENSSKRPVLLFNGFADNVFIAQFNSEDVDFEIVISNVFNTKNICYKIKLYSNQFKKYYLSRGSVQELKALETYGRQLRFGSQTTEEGKQIMVLLANHQELSPEDSSIRCSTIEFCVELEKEFEIIGPKIRVYVKYNTIKLNGESKEKQMDVRIGADNTIGQLKRLIETLEGIPAYTQSLSYKLKATFDSQTLRSYNITDKSSLYLIPRVFGGQNITESVVSRMYGRRGLVYFGQRTGQHLCRRDRNFRADKDLEIKPFSVELRFCNT